MKNDRRQGIFWFCTLAAPCATMVPIEEGILPETVLWIKGQLERGIGGFLHYQFVVAFKAKRTLLQVKKVFGRTVHAELSRSEAADAYCTKEDTRAGDPFEFGAKPIRRNSRVDWESVWLSAKSGSLEQIPGSIRITSYNNLLRIRADHLKPIAIERIVEVYWGPSETGKSRRAWEEAGPDAYSKCPRSKFWDGYQDEQNVVMDEFRGGIDIAHMLRWMDRYPIRVEVKGSTRPLNAKRIWITSNLPPVKWYPDLDPDTLEALFRRINITEMS